MKPSLRNQVLVSQAPVTPPGTTGVAALGGGGYCLGWVAADGNNWPFIDVMKNGNYVDPGGTLPVGATYDNDGWIHGLGNNTTIQFLATNNFASRPAHAFPPGDYKARTSHAGFKLQFTNCQGVTSISPQAVGSATCTVPDLGDARYDTVLRVSITTPSSGAPHSVTNLQVYLASSETLLDAGNITAPAWKADVAGAKALRFKDWMGIDGNIRRNAAYSEVRKESSRRWQMEGDGEPGHNVPYSVCARVAKECGTGMFISGSLMDKGCNYTASASTDTITVSSYDYSTFLPQVMELVNGDAICFVRGYSSEAPPTPLSDLTIYYARDVVAGVSCKVAATLGGPAINLTSDMAFTGGAVYKVPTSAEMQAFYDALIAEIFAVYPECPAIISDVGNECWNATSPYGYFQTRNVLSVRAAADNPRVPGAGNGHDGYMFAMQRMWTAVEKYFPRAQHVRMISGQWSYPGNPLHAGAYRYSDPAYFGGTKMGDLIDAHCCAGYLYPNLTGGTVPNHLTANGSFGHDFWPELVFNENWASGDNWGNGLTNYLLGDVVHEPSGINYRCTLAHTTSGATKPPNATYWTVHSTGGLTGSNASLWTDDQWAEMLQGSVTEWTAITAAYKAAMEALRTSSTAIPIVMYEVGLLYGNGGVAGHPEVQPIVERYMRFTKTTQYRSFLQDYTARYLQANNVVLPCWFLQGGEWESTANYAFSHGMKRAPHLADTPGKTYWKSITL